MRRRDFIAGLLALPVAGLCAPTRAKSFEAWALEKHLDYVTSSAFVPPDVDPIEPKLRFSITIEVDRDQIVEVHRAACRAIGRYNAAPFFGFEPGTLQLETVSGKCDADRTRWRLEHVFRAVDGDELASFAELIPPNFITADFRTLEISPE